MSVISRTHDDSRAIGADSKELLDSQIKRMTVDMPRPVHSALKRASAVEEIFMRDIIVEACREWLKTRGHLK